MADQPAADAATPDAPTPLQRQRDSLRGLLDLTTQCAADEAAIEREYSDALTAEGQRSEKAAWSLEERYKNAVEKHAETAAERAKEFHSRHAEALARHERKLRDAREKLDVQLSNTRQEIKKRYQEAQWLAESVQDGVLVEVRKQTAETKEQATNRAAAIQELEKRALQQVDRYGHPVPIDAPAADLGETPGESAGELHTERLEQATSLLEELRSLAVPRTFVGARPYLWLFAAVVLPATAVQLLHGNLDPQWRNLAIACGGAVSLVILVGTVLWFVGKAQVRRVIQPLRQALADALAASELQQTYALQQLRKRAEDAIARRTREVETAKAQSMPLAEKAQQAHAAAAAQLQSEADAAMAQIQQNHATALRDHEQSVDREARHMEVRLEQERKRLADRHAQSMAEIEARHTAAREALQGKLADGLARLQTSVAEPQSREEAPLSWDDPAWATWRPPGGFSGVVRFGSLRVDLEQIAQEVAAAQSHALTLPLPIPVDVPAMLAFPRSASVLLSADHAQRGQAIGTLQSLMTRLLVTLPPGRVRFTLVDPVGLGQNFAGFMHLADHDEALVGGRIWTEAAHIEQRLAELTEHMETVIQKYLRNEYSTIDDYNAQAGELAEPYRFLVIADFPVAMEGESLRRLSSILTSGPRCGVYTLIHYDTRNKSRDLPMDELRSHSIQITFGSDGKPTWRDPVYERFALTLDGAPPEQFITRTLSVVGQGARAARRVEVDFDAIAPAPAQMWTGSSAEDLVIPVGRTGATKLQSLRLGRGVAQHVLIAGKTGSGKSTLLHAMVTNAAMWYSPHEVEVYLVDFKKGVEFKTYATHDLPHARAIAVESDREFGLSVLQRIDRELTARGELFRTIGVQDLPSFRVARPDHVMPRTLLIIDEFQEFFSEDDKLAQDAALLLDRLVRQGRAFGIHVILGSQTIGGSSALPRSTLGQMAVRIALQCSEADSQLILGEANAAARLLSRPGEAIYNDAGGAVENNSPFQVAWLPDPRRELYLQRVQERVQRDGLRYQSPIVFEGNAPADPGRNVLLQKLLAMDTWENPPVAALYVGEPAAIKAPTSIRLRRQAGANVLIVGQNEQESLGILCAAMTAAAAQQSPERAMFCLLDGAPADSSLHGQLEAVAWALPHASKAVEYRKAGVVIDLLHQQLTQRQQLETTQYPSIYVLIAGMQRYRALRKQEESFSFSMDDGPRKPRPDQQLAELLRDGPSHGIHILATIDTLASIERTLERQLLREFDFRVLMQMSAADSSTLIDSPAANKLGFHRALLYSEEAGTMEKFRPYWLPKPAELEALASRVRGRAHEPAAFPEPAAEAEDKGTAADGAEDETSEDPLA